MGNNNYCASIFICSKREKYTLHYLLSYEQVKANSLITLGCHIHLRWSFLGTSKPKQSSNLQTPRREIEKDFTFEVRHVYTLANENK